MHRQWPIWQYLEAELDRQGIDPEVTLRSLPELGDGTPPGRRYGLVWFDRLILTAESQIKLTVAGCFHVPELYQQGEFFVKLLRFIVERYRSASFSPIEPTVVKVTRGDVKRAFPSITENLLAALPEILSHEPPTMGGSSGTLMDGEWYRELRRDLLNYGDIEDLRKYVARVSELVAVPMPPTAIRSVPSPLDLVASIDYFNVVWQLHFGEPIVRLFNAERTARLAFPINSSAEFAEQLSSLSELVKNLRVNSKPQTGKTPLARLRTLNAEVTDDGALSRISDAVEVLEKVVQVRNSLFQHSGTEHKGVRALNELGIRYPVPDWAGAWIILQTEIIGALSVLREEVQVLHQSGI